MVVVQCYNCSNILELDEGFRGGVCRCSQCGSLLQVPKAASADVRKTRPAAPGAQPTVVQRPSDPSADPGLSRGQFDPRSPTRPASPEDSRVGARAIGVAKVVSPPAHKPGVHKAAVKKNRTLLYVAIALMLLVGVAILVGLIYVFANTTNPTIVPKETPPAPIGTPGGFDHGRVEPPSPPNNPITPTPPPAPTISGPAFLDNIPLTGKNVVFSIDGGGSSVDCFDYLRSGIKLAVGTLAPGQRFAVAVWNGSEIKRFPATGWASKATLANVEKDFDGVGAYGSSDAVECMKQSIQLGGDQTIFVTAKYGLTPDMAPPVLAVRKQGQRIDAIKITSTDTDSPLAKIVNASGGKFIDQMDVGQLENLVGGGR